MAGRVYGLQCILSGRKNCTAGDLLVSHRHPLPAESVYIYTQAIAQRNSSSHMIGMPVRDEDAPDAAALRSRLHNGIQGGAIVNGRINDQRTLGTTAKKNRIRSRPRHNRRVTGQDECVWLLHE